MNKNTRGVWRENSNKLKKLAITGLPVANPVTLGTTNF